MQANNQNKFYTSISKYYSEIFPFNSMQLQFVRHHAGNLKGKNILDIGCATGELAFHLAKEGAKVTGIDLNKDLLKLAKTKNVHANISFQLGDMLNLKNDFCSGQFDLVLCFGNTLVHLLSKDMIQKMLSGVFTVLKPGGQFLLQILNYEYIIEDNITELPVIETENIKFIRKYKFQEDSPLILFQTELYLKQTKESVSNETELLALKSYQLTVMLRQSNFTNVELYANFKMDQFGGKHIPLVLSCKK